MKHIPDRFRKIMIIFFWLCLWQVLTMVVDNDIFLVGPMETLAALAGKAGSPDFFKAVWFSFMRISLGFFCAFLSGLITGSLAWRFSFVDEFLEPAIRFIKSIPVASFVILALIWTGSSNLSVFISFLVVYPVIHINTTEGLKSTDPELLEMAHVFRVPWYRKISSIYRVSLFPYLVSGLKSSLGMGFKSGIAAEVIGVPTGSIGENLYLAKIYLDTADLFAWTLTIILVSSLFETIFLKLFRLLFGKGVLTGDGT